MLYIHICVYSYRCVYTYVYRERIDEPRELSDPSMERCDESRERSDERGPVCCGWVCVNVCTCVRVCVCGCCVCDLCRSLHQTTRNSPLSCDRPCSCCRCFANLQFLWCFWFSLFYYGSRCSLTPCCPFGLGIVVCVGSVRPLSVDPLPKLSGYLRSTGNRRHPGLDRGSCGGTRHSSAGNEETVRR